jgi:hypothetical protein
MRALETTSIYSAGAREYVSSFSQLHFFLPKAEEPLFPGFLACSLALLAVATFGVMPLRSTAGIEQRGVVWLYTAVGMLGIVLSLGPSGGLFSFLFHALPPYQGLRVPSRAAILFLFAVSVLAAFGLSRVKGKLTRTALITFAAMESYAGPLPWSFETPVLPPIYQELASLSEPGAIVELPLPPPERFQDNVRYVYRSIFHWRPLVNGYSGFVPPSYRRAFETLMRGNVSYGLQELSTKGVRFALVHTSRLGPRMRRQIQAAVDSGQLRGISEMEGDRLYRIREPVDRK